MTQKEIAKELNISRSTVARAFNGGRINAETKNKILKFAEENGYKPNNLAQTLVRKKDKIVNFFLIDSISPTYIEDIIKGINFIEKKFEEFKIKVKIYQRDAREENSDIKQYYDIIETLENQNLDILVVSFINNKYIDEIIKICNEKNIVLISLETPTSNENIICHIGPSYEKLGSLTADFIVTGLREKGKILILNYEDNCDINKKRMYGFCKFIENFPNIEIEIKELTSLAQENFNKVLSSVNLNKYDSIYSSFNPENIFIFLSKNKIDKKFFIVANDLNDEIKNLLFQRKIMGIIYQRPFYEGMIALESIYNYLIKNTPLPPKINIEIDILLKENISLGLYADLI